jgi:hypothetical protein
VIESWLELDYSGTRASVPNRCVFKFKPLGAAVVERSQRRNCA